MERDDSCSAWIAEFSRLDVGKKLHIWRCLFCPCVLLHTYNLVSIKGYLTVSLLGFLPGVFIQPLTRFRARFHSTVLKSALLWLAQDRKNDVVSTLK